MTINRTRSAVREAGRYCCAPECRPAIGSLIEAIVAERNIRRELQRTGSRKPFRVAVLRFFKSRKTVEFCNKKSPFKASAKRQVELRDDVFDDGAAGDGEAFIAAVVLKREGFVVEA